MELDKIWFRGIGVLWVLMLVAWAALGHTAGEAMILVAGAWTGLGWFANL